MRVLLSAVIITCFILPSVPLLAQKKKIDPKDIFKDKDKTQMVPGDKSPEGPSLNTPIGGKTIDEWIDEIPSADPSKSENAIRTVLLFGPELGQRAVPDLLKLVNKSRTGYTVDLSVRVNGVIALGELLDERNEPDPAFVKSGVYVLKGMLKDKQAIVKYRAAKALARMGPDARGATSQLIITLRDISTWEVRQAAAHALGRVAYDKKKGAPINVINALWGALKVDPAFQVRLAAIQAFAWLGPPADEKSRVAVYTALEQVATKDSEPTVKIWAHMAVMNIKGKPDPDRIKLIAKQLKDDDVLVRVQAAQAIMACGLEGKAAVPQLIDALDDEESPVVSWAVMALSKMGRFAEPAMGKLQKIVKDEDMPSMVRDTAQEIVDVVQGNAVKTDDKKKKRLLP